MRKVTLTVKGHLGGWKQLRTLEAGLVMLQMKDTWVGWIHQLKDTWAGRKQLKDTFGGPCCK